MTVGEQVLKIEVDSKLIKEIRLMLLEHSLLVVPNMHRPIIQCANCGYRYDTEKVPKVCTGGRCDSEHFLVFKKLNLEEEFGG